MKRKAGQAYDASDAAHFAQLHAGEMEQAELDTFGIVFGSITVFCMVVLRRFRHISALDALRFGMAPDKRERLGKHTLSESRITNVNLFLGLKEVCDRFRVYGLLCFVFILCSFLMIVPINFLNTLQSPNFVAYMGAGKCNLRLDLQHTPDIIARYAEAEEYDKKPGDSLTLLVGNEERHSEECSTSLVM